MLERLVGWSRVLGSTRAAPFGDRPLTSTQMDALFLLAHGGGAITPGALAASLGVTPGAVTQLIDPLRTDGIVEVAPNPADRRSRVIRLSAKARTAIATYETETARALAARFASLDDSELAALADLLTRTEGPP